MFEHLKEQPADKILALMAAYKADPRPVKIDLGVGVYKNAEGVTPVMRAVKAAEQKLWEVQDSKAYVGLLGDASFSDVMIDLVLGDAVPREAVAAAATPGGTGAVRQAFELIKMASPDARLFVSNPTWPNHVSMAKYVGLNMVEYRYFDEDSCGVDFEGMKADLADVKAGDVVLLHGCCHNPTGANLNPAQWQEVIGLMQKAGAVAMIDIAYQGFGDGLDEDAEATRRVVEAMPETLIAASCSKNFGVYRERTGVLMAVSQDTSRTELTKSTLAYLNRQNFSFPPDHGARIVTMVLQDDALRADWKSELEDVRVGMLALREQLASELQARSGSDRYGFLAQHRGMFSRLGVGPDVVERLRAEHAVYMVGDSRMNIAGLNKETIPLLAKAIVECT